MSSYFPVPSSSFLSCWCCVTQCSRGARHFVGACCVQFVVMICYREAFVDIPPAKNRTSLWQRCYRLACDALHVSPSQGFIPSLSLLEHTCTLTETLSPNAMSCFICFSMCSSAAVILDNVPFVGHSHSWERLGYSRGSWRPDEIQMLNDANQICHKIQGLFPPGHGAKCVLLYH